MRSVARRKVPNAPTLRACNPLVALRGYAPEGERRGTMPRTNYAANANGERVVSIVEHAARRVLSQPRARARARVNAHRITMARAERLLRATTHGDSVSYGALSRHPRHEPRLTRIEERESASSFVSRHSPLRSCASNQRETDFTRRSWSNVRFTVAGGMTRERTLRQGTRYVQLRFWLLGWLPACLALPTSSPSRDVSRSATDVTLPPSIRTAIHVNVTAFFKLSLLLFFSSVVAPCPLL